MGFEVTRAQRRELERENARRPVWLEPVPRDEWPRAPPSMVAVWRSRDFLVQVYRERVGLVPSGRWVDGIAWDELQRLKREAGYGELDAVEVYPADRDVVNVGNLRHLWVFEDRALDFAWRARR